MPSFSQLRSLAILAVSMALLNLSGLCAAQNSSAVQTAALNGRFRIAGTVVSVTGGHPLARARVLIIDARNPQNIQSFVTSEDGRFEFQVNAGKYALQGARRGFLTAAYDAHDQFSTAIVTGTGLDTENLVLRLAPAAVLSGRVLDEFGDPVRHAAIMVYREDHYSGVGLIRPFRRGSTDDQGTYEVRPLNDGTYFLSVSAKPWYAVHPVSTQSGSETSPSHVDPSLDVTYPSTYYGDATEADEAMPIPVRGGDHLEVDVHLNPVPALHLIFHVPEDATRGISWPVLQKPAFDGMESVQTDGVQMVSPGVYEMTGVAPGRYTVRMPGATTGQLEAPAKMDVTQQGQELDVSSGEPTSKVKASVQLRSGGAIPTELRVFLRNSKKRIVAVAQVDAKGEVDFQDVSPGKYDVLAGFQNKEYSVVRIASQSGRTSGHALNVPAASSLTVSLWLVEGIGIVEGFAKQGGKSVAGAMVVLVPKDPESNRELFRRDQSDLDGSFSLKGVVPGSYTITAIDNGWDLDWAKPAVIAHYCQHAQKLVVGERAKGSVFLTNPVEVQPR